MTTPVRGLTCFRKRATVARDDTVRYPPLVMTSLAPGPSSIGCRCPARVPQLLAAAGRTLRAGRHVMLDDTGAQQIVTDDVIVQLGAKAGSDRLGDFEGGKLDCALSERVAGER